MADASSSPVQSADIGPTKPVFHYGGSEKDSESNAPTRDISGDVLDDGLRRGLKGRHFVIIALGSIIGPGTYWGIGYAILLSGPLGALLGFLVVGISMWFLMQSVGEMTTLFPVHGGFVEHAGRFVDPALSFAMSWLYYLMWSVFLASGMYGLRDSMLILTLIDWNSAILTLRFWISDDQVPSWAWTIIFFVVFTVMTLLGVRVYGEIEYYFGMFKFVSLILLFILSIVSNTGGFGGGYTGFKYWKKPTGMNVAGTQAPTDYLTGPIVNGIDGFGQVFVLAAAYYVGTEIISLAGGESKNPKRDVPRVCSSL